MQSLTIDQIIEGTGGSLLAGTNEGEVCSVTTDSRTACPGSLFIPLKGERFDGHDFLEQVIKQGAAAVLTSRDISSQGSTAVIRVADTFQALKDLAQFYKALYPVPTVAIVGSVGKTTTKDMVSGVLSRKYNTLKTQGNFNNEIGLPLTVFGLEKEHQMAVLEMGMSGFGEIHRLAQIGRPDTAVMTNIGMSHIEKLGSQENIFKAKMEVADFFGKDNTLIVNGDDTFLSTVRGRGGYSVIYYGIKNPENDVRAENVEDHGVDGISFDIISGETRYPAQVTVPGVHNVYNALAAFAVGTLYGVPAEEILQGIKSFERTKMRMAVEEIGGMTVINDCYNAAPDSVKAGLGVLKSIRAKRRIAILGDVLEMGDFAPAAHTEMGAAVGENGIDMLIAAGENSRHTAQSAQNMGVEAHWFLSTEEAADFAADTVCNGDALLIKASRGMHFEKIYQMIKERNE